MTDDKPVSTWAHEQFGDQAADVARRVVEALAEAQRRGIEAQQASGLTKRYTYGSTWSAKYELFVEYMADLTGAVTRHVPGTSYDLVVLNRRLLVPFVMGRTVSEAHNRPRRLSSHPLLDILTGLVPVVEHQYALPGVDQFLRTHLPTRFPVPHPRPVPDAIPPVLIGEVCNADVDDLLELWWGTLEKLTPDGDLSWAPEQIPLR